MVNIACQTILTLLCAGTIALISLGGRCAKWGFVLGLVSRVFWARLAIVHAQVDIGLLAVWYTGFYAYGAWRSFRKGKAE